MTSFDEKHRLYHFTTQSAHIYPIILYFLFSSSEAENKLLHKGYMYEW